MKRRKTTEYDGVSVIDPVRGSPALPTLVRNARKASYEAWIRGVIKTPFKTLTQADIDFAIKIEESFEVYLRDRK